MHCVHAEHFVRKRYSPCISFMVFTLKHLSFFFFFSDSELTFTVFIQGSLRKLRRKAIIPETSSRHSRSRSSASSYYFMFMIRFLVLCELLAHLYILTLLIKYLLYIFTSAYTCLSVFINSIYISMSISILIFQSHDCIRRS